MGLVGLQVSCSQRSLVVAGANARCLESAVEPEPGSEGGGHFRMSMRLRNI
jgi:hypothetical protein